MQNNKSIRHFQWISGIVALFFIFMLMSLSDVLRLNPSLAGVSRSELGKTAREASVSVTTRVAIPAEDYNNEDKVDFSDEGVGATLTGAESSFVLQEETYPHPIPQRPDRRRRSPAARRCPHRSSLRQQLLYAHCHRSS